MTIAREVRDRYTAGDNWRVDRLLAATSGTQGNEHSTPTTWRRYSAPSSPTGVAISPEGVSRGREELASCLEEFWEAFPDVQAVVVESFDIEDSTVGELLIVGTHRGPYTMPDGQVIPATGRPIRLRCCYVCTIEDDLVASLRLYFDQLELLTQLSCSTTFHHG
ncbi:ester cyclase [Nonomuraea sp. NPDC051191]|uniref:ester cyclase n=1 Tax=Nonomuraea sp. NPDC051191 TaxID=3364372 RepID=UPI003796248F